MQAISVHFVPPTDCRPARWRVKCEAFSFLVSCDCRYSGEESARAALQVALTRYRDEKYPFGPDEFAASGWASPMVLGGLAGGGYVAVTAGSEPFVFDFRGASMAEQSVRAGKAVAS
jgi:hypothetical protein